jgi:hypothetical protein
MLASCRGDRYLLGVSRDCGNVSQEHRLKIGFLYLKNQVDWLETGGV